MTYLQTQTRDKPLIPGDLSPGNGGGTPGEMTSQQNLEGRTDRQPERLARLPQQKTGRISDPRQVVRIGSRSR